LDRQRLAMSNFSHRQEGESFNKAPEQVGRNDIGYENLKVNCLLWPDKLELGKFLSKASVAVRGNIVGDEEIDEDMVADMFKGGLNQGLEAFSVSFECSGVSRGVTHQLVRTRKATFAQQSMRYADMGNFNARMPITIAEDPYAKIIWLDAVETARRAYNSLAQMGIPMQDVRTVTPTAVETYIICTYPLNEFLNTYAYRACQMFYPETVALFGLMKQALIEKCPWLKEHIKITCEKTSGGIKGLPHKCNYQGWERVEETCTFPWALEENRTFKSRKVLE